MACDNKALTERIAARYSEILHSRLPGAHFFIGDDSTITEALKGTTMRVVRDFDRSESSLVIEGYLRADGSLNEEVLIPSYSDALADAVTGAAANAGVSAAGQLWIFHNIISVPLTADAAVVHFVKSNEVGVFGQSWFDKTAKKMAFAAMTEWGIRES
ncbi:MAG: hypothetical protein ABSB15_26355 [Bryobacteraceae bacterium]|jgi:hypothetical protein